MIIAVTGTPGTGKTEVSKKLANVLGYKYIDLNRLTKEKGLILEYDKKRKTHVVDTDKLKDLELPDNSVIDSHLSHFVSSDFVIVLRTRPDILERRLKKKVWHNGKIQENLEAEILGVCSSEALENNDKVFEVDTSKKSPEQVAKTIKAIVNNKISAKEIDWLEDYEHMIRKE